MMLVINVRRIAVAVSALAIVASSPQIQAHSQDPLEHAVTAPAASSPLEGVSGIVRELIIEDKVAGMTVRYLSMVPQSGKPVALVGTGVQSLADGANVTVTGKRNGNVLFVDSVRGAKAARATTPAATAHVEGKLALAHADNFDTGQSEYLYEVHEDGGHVTPLKLNVRPEALQPGMRVAAHGNRQSADAELDPSRIEVLALPDVSLTDATANATETKLGAVTAKAATNHSVLFVLVKFSDTASDPMAVSSVQSVVSSASNSVANFYKEASYGQHLINATVTPWVRAAISTPTTCNYSAISTAANTAATAAGYNPNNYEFKVYIMPRLTACGWSGLGYIGFPRMAWINGPSSVTTPVIGHEMGHNFGLLHAASVDCGTRSVGGVCTASEYGDPFNTMGNQTSMHFDATQKALLGWIPSTSVKTHASGSATYTLNPIESAGGSVYAVKIAAAAKRTYWLEYRQPIGFDSALASYPNNGAQIRVSSPFETMCGGCDAYSNDTQLLDMTPTTSSFWDGALVAGKSYVDPDYGFTINVLSATPSGLTVQVTGPGGPPPPPPTKTASTTVVSTSVNPATAGSMITFTATVTGTAPTGAVAFKDNGAVLGGCSAVALSGTGNARTAKCSTTALSAGSHSIVASYAGDTGNYASTSNVLGQTVQVTVIASSNVALASAGSTVIGSSALSSGYALSLINNNDRAGRRSTGFAGWWNDATASKYPDWVQVTFPGYKTIDRIVVYTLQDNYNAPVEPTDTMTFTKYGLRDYAVQIWNGSAWVSVGSTSNNSLVKRSFSFTPVMTNSIRVYVTRAADGWSRITEIEAWGK
jgi:hypothetical protein